MITGAAIFFVGLVSGWYVYAYHAHQVCRAMGLQLRFVRDDEVDFLDSIRAYHERGDADVLAAVDRAARQERDTKEELARARSKAEDQNYMIG